MVDFPDPVRPIIPALVEESRIRDEIDRAGTSDETVYLASTFVYSILPEDGHDDGGSSCCSGVISVGVFFSKLRILAIAPNDVSSDVQNSMRYWKVVSRLSTLFKATPRDPAFVELRIVIANAITVTAIAAIIRPSARLSHR